MTAEDVNVDVQRVTGAGIASACFWHRIIWLLL